MKTKGFGAWPQKNILSGGQQAPRDAYNKALKGSERAPSAGEYASKGLEGYHSYSSTMTAEEYAQKQRQKRADQNGKSGNAKSARQRVLQQVAGLLVGSVVIVSTYQAMAQQQPVSEPTTVVQTNEQNPDTSPVSLSPSWNWSEDRQTVILELFDSNGNLIKEIPAAVTVSEIEATCNQEGQKTYTASVKDEDNEYSDSQSETLPPLGHAFDEGREIVLENGQTAMTFECTRCHEQFTIKTSMTEND